MPTPAEPAAAHDMLLAFLREHDADCPACGYNLRALTQPVCPECGTELVLSVGVRRVRLGWLLAAVAPGFFSGIAAFFVLLMIVARLIWGDGRQALALNAVDAFGWCSLGVAIWLARRRHRFLALRFATQGWITAGIWAAHVAALGLFILIGPRYMR